MLVFVPDITCITIALCTRVSLQRALVLTRYYTVKSHETNSSVDYWLLDTQMQPLNLDLTHRVVWNILLLPGKGKLNFPTALCKCAFLLFFLFIFLFSRRLESFNNW